MDIMLASFGLAQDIYWKSKGSSISLEEQSIFYDTPPFVPTRYLALDITPFVLYDKVIINQSWIDINQTWMSNYRGVMKEVSKNSILDSENIAELIRKGVVEPRDYALDTRNNLDLLEKITNSDLSKLDLWRDALLESTSIWNRYAYEMHFGIEELLSKHQLSFRTPFSNSERNLYSAFYHMGSIRSPQEFITSIRHSKLRKIIQDYLLSINNNLLLSREYSVGLFDWFDYEPLYKTKLMLGKVAPTSTISTVTRGGTILSFYLPIERINTVQELMQVRDKAKGLREYIEAKQRDDKGADERMLLKILLDIERAQRKAAYYQKISSYFTLPLSLIPLVGPFAERIVKDVVDWQIEKKVLDDFRWHFSLLDYATLKDDINALAEQKLETLVTDVVYENFDDIQQCEAATKTGRRCRNMTRPGLKFCWKHKSQNK